MGLYQRRHQLHRNLWGKRLDGAVSRNFRLLQLVRGAERLLFLSLAVKKTKLSSQNLARAGYMALQTSCQSKPWHAACYRAAPAPRSKVACSPPRGLRLPPASLCSAPQGACAPRSKVACSPPRGLRLPPASLCSAPQGACAPRSKVACSPPRGLRLPPASLCSAPQGACAVCINCPRKASEALAIWRGKRHASQSPGMPLAIAPRQRRRIAYARRRARRYAASDEA